MCDKPHQPSFTIRDCNEQLSIVFRTDGKVTAYGVTFETPCAFANWIRNMLGWSERLQTVSRAYLNNGVITNQRALQHILDKMQTTAWGKTVNEYCKCEICSAWLSYP